MVSENSKTIKPWRVVLAAWVIMALLAVVFAADIDRYAKASESPAAGLLSQLSGPFSQSMEALGVTALRANAADGMREVYAATPVIGAGSLPAEPVAQLQVADAAPDAAAAAASVALLSQGGKVQRVLIIGDSFIEAQIGAKIDDILVKQYGLTVERFGQRSTGLARPDYFNWPKKVAEMKAAFQPDLIIGSWGANDCQALTNPEGKVIAKFDTKEWDAEYGRRVSLVVAEMTAGGCKAVVVGLPAMRSRSLATRINHLNGVMKQSAEAGGANFMSIWEMSVDQNGKYLASIKVNGQDKLLRMADGVHFSGPGAEYVSEKLCITMAGKYGWVKK